MRLRVNGSFLDQYSNTVIAQTFSVNDLGDITTRQGGFSNRFTLPLSDNNADILGFPNDINSSSSNPYSRVSAELIDSGAVIALGYLKYQQVSNKDIECTFFSDNVDWFSLISDKKLTDLNLSAYDHTYHYDTMMDSLINDGSDGYIYPIIDYGSLTDLSNPAISFSDLFPAIFVSIVFERIFFEIGYKVQGELLDLIMYPKMIIPFSAEAFVHTSQWVLDNTITDTEDSTPIINNGNVQESIDWTAAGGTSITIGKTSNYIIDVYITANYNLTSGTGDNDLQFEVLDGAIVEYTITGYVLTDGDHIFKFSTDARGYNAASNLSVRATMTVNSGVGDLTFTGGTITITPTESIDLNGEEVQMSATLPDISQVDFVNYILTSFGVLPIVNSYSKTINMYLHRNIKNRLSSAVDWSDKIDLGKDININFSEKVSNYFKRSIFTYLEDDSDTYLTTYKNEIGEVFGSGDFSIANDHLGDFGTYYEAPFAPTINITSIGNDFYIPYIPLFEYDSTSMTYVRRLSPKPRILLKSDPISLLDLTIDKYIQIDIDGPGGAISANTNEIPFLWFVKTEFIAEVDSLKDALNYDATAFPNEVGDPLIPEFLEGYQDSLNQFKMVQAYFHLNEVDIGALNFSTPVYVDYFKSYFYLNKIENYTGSNMTTKVELIRIP